MKVKSSKNTNNENLVIQSKYYFMNRFDTCVYFMNDLRSRHLQTEGGRVTEASAQFATRTILSRYGKGCIRVDIWTGRGTEGAPTAEHTI